MNNVKNGGSLAEENIQPIIEADVEQLKHEIKELKQVIGELREQIEQLSYQEKQCSACNGEGYMWVVTGEGHHGADPRICTKCNGSGG